MFLLKQQQQKKNKKNKQKKKTKKKKQKKHWQCSFLGVDFSRSINSLIYFLEFKEPIFVSEIALGSSEVGVFSSGVVGAVVYEED